MVYKSYRTGNDAFGARMNHAVMLNYKRTLSDIPYTAISSVINWADAYNYSVGNPNLKAQSADMVMAVYPYSATNSTLRLCTHTHTTAYIGRLSKTLQTLMYSIPNP